MDLAGFRVCKGDSWCWRVGCMHGYKKCQQIVDLDISLHNWTNPAGFKQHTVQDVGRIGHVVLPYLLLNICKPFFNNSSTTSTPISQTVLWHQYMVCLGGFNTSTPFMFGNNLYATIIKSLSKLKNHVSHTHIHFPQAPTKQPSLFFPSFTLLTSTNVRPERSGAKVSPSRPRSNPRLPSFLRRNVGRSLRPLKQEVLVKEGKYQQFRRPFWCRALWYFCKSFFFLGRLKVINTHTHTKTLPQKRRMVYCNKS